MSQVTNGMTYQKGGWVLHMLRTEVGTGNFWTAIREYYRRYRNTNASTADLREVFEQVSGKELDWFFAQWLNRPGVPKIEGSWRYDAAKRSIEVTVTQSQPAPAFKVALDVGIIGKTGELPKVSRIEFAAKQGVFSFPADATPAAVVLDPNTTLLMEAGAFAKRP
jgi:aminopeptidase N